VNWLALRMLTGDRAKYLGLVFGIAFSTLLMTQQSAMFVMLLRSTTSQIRDVQGADLWIMDPNVQFVDDVKPLSENALYQVRGVQGIAWATRLYKGLVRARLEDGNFQQMILLGLDDDTLVGAPRQMTLGSLADLRRPDAVIIDETGFRYLWPGEPFELGRVLELNDRRAVIVGICKASPTFQTFPILYARYSQAVDYAPAERKTLSFILAQPEPGAPLAEVCRRVEEQTGLVALSREQFLWRTIGYYLRRTGIPINFGMTTLLGFVVGSAIAGQTFYMFTVENLKQFGSLKAMGVGNLRLVAMILLQAVVVGLVGYGLGLGLAVVALKGMVGAMTAKGIGWTFWMPWQVVVGAGLAVLLITMLASLLSIRRVLQLEPAVVFK
jgi:putative ABC transport system permease protein